MKNLATVVCVVGMLAGSAAAQDAVQWRVEDGGNGHWYALRDMNSLSWRAHRLGAEGLGAHLVTITSSTESAFVRALIPMGIPGYGQNYLFGPTIGLSQVTDANEPAGGWSWVTGEPLGFSDWYPGEPNDGPGIGEEWVRYRFTNGTIAWNDVAQSMIPGDLCCNPLVEFALIEWSVDCNNDGTVDYGQIRSGELDDANLNNIPDCCEAGVSCIPCEGDVSGNGVVDGVDLAAVLGAWGSSGKGEFSTDTNGDGVVDGTDLATVLSGWGPCPS
jgi:hypothetical protein